MCQIHIERQAKNVDYSRGKLTIVGHINAESCCAHASPLKQLCCVRLPVHTRLNSAKCLTRKHDILTVKAEKTAQLFERGTQAKNFIFRLHLLASDVCQRTFNLSRDAKPWDDGTVGTPRRSTRRAGATRVDASMRKSVRIQ